MINRLFVWTRMHSIPITTSNPISILKPLNNYYDVKYQVSKQRPVVPISHSTANNDYPFDLYEQECIPFQLLLVIELAS